MYWLAEICVRRPVFALMLILALVVAGLAAFPNLGVDRFPNIDMPSVFVSTRYPGASPSEVETEITQVVEDAVATVAGIEELRSITSEGSSFVIVTFNLTRQVDAAVQDVRDAVAGVSRSLPPGIDPPIIQKRDLESSPIMSLAISGPRSSNELYFLAERYLKGVIESAPGVGGVYVAGAAERAVRVDVDARQLAARGISILQVREALARQNVDIPGGLVHEGMRERSLRTIGRLDDSADFPDLVVDTVDGTPIRLSDLGTVSDATKELRTIARLNGEAAVIVWVEKQSGANTVHVIDEIKQRLPRSQQLIPQDCHVTILQDQSNYIVAALHEIERHLISGSILACLIVLLFMRSWRSTLIAAVAIPTSIIGTFAFMRAFGFTLNNVTMLALVLMVGVVIDDAIVVLENIFHCVEEKQMSPVDAAIKGTREIGLAVLASTLSLVIVFLPVSFLSSVTGRMLYQFGITATVAVLISMFVSFTLTPMMCSKLLRGSQRGGPNRGGEGGNGDTPRSRRGFYRYIEQAYLYCLRWSLKARWLVLLLAIGVIGSNYFLYQIIRQDYIPTNVDESEFEVRLRAREGTSLTSMDEAMAAAEQELKSIQGVELILATVGARGWGGVNNGDIFVRLTDIDERTFSLGRLWRGLLQGDPLLAFRGNFSQQDVMQQARSRLNAIPNVSASVRNLTSMRTGAPVDIDFSITGPDIERLYEFSEQLKARAEEIPGIVDVDTTLKLEKPELLVAIDRERAAAMGVDVAEIAETLRVAVGGDDRVSRYRDSTVDDAYDVELRLVGIDRQDVESISQIYVRGTPTQSAESSDSSGQPPLIRVDNLVSFSYGNALARIDRLDRQRMVAIRANVESGYALQDRIDQLEQAVEEIGLPAGFATQIMGRGRELDRTLTEFVWTFLMSIIFMYIVLAAQFENLLHPLTILFTLPLAIPFGLLSLYWGGETLNVYSALGILVLFGVVKKAAILQVDHTNALRAAGMPRAEAIIQANRDRLRPILMTTFSFVAGLMPLLIATGPGAEERRSIAVLAVGGQTFSLLLTLLAVPVMYSLLDDLSQWAQSWVTRRESPDGVASPRLASE